MSLSVRASGRASVIAVGGEVDIDNAEELAEAITSAAAARPGALILELREVTFADSSAVNVLLRAHGALGPRLALAALSPFMDRLLDITGVSRVLRVHETAAAALTAADLGRRT
ncbi:STAS domain-containing protein [Streptomyces sp. NPDC059785]|uniref:STAS domain-containing protein n=1 Tax=unclassified Streptomyces TaxID=2593676 RepID=UPI00365BBAF4